MGEIPALPGKNGTGRRDFSEQSGSSGGQFWNAERNGAAE